MNMIVPEEIGGAESYYNLELLHLSCQQQHQKLLEKYGEGKKLQKVINYFEMKQVEPNSPEGYKLMKEAFKKFKYQHV